MAFCRKMYDTINFIFLKNLMNRFRITNIRFHKGIILSVFYGFQIFQISCIGQFIYIDNTNFISILFKHIMNIIRSDKSCPACH